MIYFKRNSIPLEEDSPAIGDKTFDIYGNYIEYGLINDKPTIIVPTVLNEYERLDRYEKENFLKAYWSWMNKEISKKHGV